MYVSIYTKIAGGRIILRSLSTDATGELHIFGHDRHTLGVDGSQVGVLEETHKVSLSGLLQGKDGRPLESQVCLEVLSDLTDQALEGQLADEELRALLVAADLTQGDRPGAVTVGLLHAARGGRGLARRLGGQLLAGRLASVLLRAVCLVRAMVECLLCVLSCIDWNVEVRATNTNASVNAITRGVARWCV